jgi:hypothetical protein
MVLEVRVVKGWLVRDVHAVYDVAVRALLDSIANSKD